MAGKYYYLKLKLEKLETEDIYTWKK